MADADAGTRDAPDAPGGSGAPGRGPDEAAPDARAAGEGDGREPGEEPDRDRPARRHPADESLHTGELPDAARCPHCGGTDTEQHGAFGSAVSVSQYWCRECRTVFEFFKWR